MPIPSNMDARRIVVKYDTMISCAVDNVPTSSLKFWRGVRCGARRLVISRWSGDVNPVKGRIVLSFANMISIINGVARWTDIWTDFPLAAWKSRPLSKHFGHPVLPAAKDGI